MNYVFISPKLGEVIAESRINTGFLESALGNYDILYERVTWIWRWGKEIEFQIFLINL